MKRWTRRSLMIGGTLLALPIVGVIAGKIRCRSYALPQGASLRAMLASTYPNSTELAALGRRYLEEVGSTASVSLKRLQALEPVMVAAETGCRAQTTSAIEQACRDDYCLGRVYIIDGWVLARTELDVAAAFTLV